MISAKKSRPETATEWQIKQACTDAQRIAAGDRRVGSRREIDQASARARRRIRGRAALTPKTPSTPRQLVRFFNVRVHRDGKLERIIVSDRGAHGIDRQWRWMTIQDAEYLIGQLRRAIKRAPRAR